MPRLACDEDLAGELQNRATEGLEFETADRYGDQVAAAGGVEAWKARLDADPRRWAERTRGPSSK